MEKYPAYKDNFGGKILSNMSGQYPTYLEIEAEDFFEAEKIAKKMGKVYVFTLPQFRDAAASERAIQIRHKVCPQSGKNDHKIKLR